MLLLSLALSCTLLTALTAWRGERMAAQVHGSGRDLLRAQILLAEAERCRASLRALATAQRLGETAVDLGTHTVRAVHEGIASIPFGILEAIPLTRAPTRLVRALHDAIAGGVYDTITGVNRAVGSGLRQQLDAPPRDGSREK